jgi:hypothetical protein
VVTQFFLFGTQFLSQQFQKRNDKKERLGKKNIKERKNQNQKLTNQPNPKQAVYRLPTNIGTDELWNQSGFLRAKREMDYLHFL